MFTVKIGCEIGGGFIGAIYIDDASVATCRVPGVRRKLNDGRL